MPEINTEKLLEDVKKTSQEAGYLGAKRFYEELKQAEEQKAKEKRIENVITDTGKLKEQISVLTKQLEELSSNTKSFCERFPQLCKDIDDVKAKVSDLEKKTVTPEVKKEVKPEAKPEAKPKGIAGTSHTTLEELLECPECKVDSKVRLFLDLLKKVSPQKAAERICGDDEMCKATLAELVKKGYKVEAPKKEEFGESAFTIARPSKLN